MTASIRVPFLVSGGSSFQRLKLLVHDVGIRVAVLHLLQKILRLPPFLVRINSPYALFPLWCRLGTSDLLVFRQIFCDREYSCLDDMANAGLIFDCGANVGYSTAYFLSQFPQAFVTAIEPDPANFLLLQKNLTPYAGRFLSLQAAVWPREIGLAFSRLPAHKQKAWEVSVHESLPGERAEIKGVTISELLEKSGFNRISILKIDIEGAEKDIFSDNAGSWLSKVAAIVIELHDLDAREVFRKAIANQDFNLSYSGELTVCRRPCLLPIR